jgi:hypothetical protein
MRRNDQLLLVSILVAAGTVAFACTSTTDGGSTPGTGGASSQQVGQCKSGCDKMKFFDCSTAEELARCYGDCDKATPSQIEIFNACAQNSICDPSCRTNIEPAGSPTTGGGATPSSCTTACDKLVTCSAIKVGDKAACLDVCQKEAYQYQIDCVNKTECSKLAATCGNVSEGGGGESSSSGGSSGTTTSSGGSSGSSSFDVMRCQSACDSLKFFDCLDAAEQSACRSLCSTAAAAKRDTFTSCANAAGSDCTDGQDCYSVFKN